MKILDTLSANDARVTLIDIRAGLLSSTLRAFQNSGFFDAVRAGDFTFGLFHVLGPSVASLEEIAEVSPYAENGAYFAVKNFINETSFFDWDPAVKAKYFEGSKDLH